METTKPLLAAFILLAMTSCERPAEKELPDFQTTAYPLANEYAICLRRPPEPEKMTFKRLDSDSTVLDALTPLSSELGGLGKMNIWLVRIGPKGGQQVLKVDWAQITEGGQTTTNFLLRGGDRLILEPRKSGE